MKLFNRNSRKSTKPAPSINSNHSIESPSTKMSVHNMPATPTTPMHIDMSKVTLPRAPDPRVDPAAYLRSIGAVRERSKIVLEKAKRNQLNHFTVDLSKFEDTASFVVSIIKVILQECPAAKDSEKCARYNQRC